mmetsp:Transcript_22352/g.50531  ORF Transcript_22352/g.50531 Transcript_22352/m.50531 type:complete len:139 (+) Transcript_22352:147-563(+)|eukprot:CAMPEP_0172630708 /NCGR_PEP_ID=MMETSP1068-20121228/175050_1 /TAXON_ID=35684 /ORGANISM="Pseudopedinella elastica, Strain CCMP716" /LENGTH=138 /DNA_ID=CAMNT_0013441625 /DNA_START=29 /DNA_END=445 /DNA_ORIENTATION=+
MSFFWSSTPEPAKKPAPTKAKEFDDLLASKDLELQAILEGGSIEDIGKKDNVKENVIGNATSRAAPRAAAQSSMNGILPLPHDSKMISEHKMWLGVPRNYIILIVATMTMGGLLAKFMGFIDSSEADVSTKTTAVYGS